MEEPLCAVLGGASDETGEGGGIRIGELAGGSKTDKFVSGETVNELGGSLQTGTSGIGLRMRVINGGWHNGG